MAFSAQASAQTPQYLHLETSITGKEAYISSDERILFPKSSSKSGFSTSKSAS